MKTRFKQGIIYAKRNQGTPAFLSADSTLGFINHIVDEAGTTLTFAHGISNYLVKIHTNKMKFWGPIDPAVQNWLFWDVDLMTGRVTGGSTSIAPINSATAPVNPANDQHWFDTAESKMKVWTDGFWAEKVRLFAGKVDGGSVIAHQEFNSQIGITQATDAGFIMFDQGLQPVRLSTGQFFTTDHQCYIDSAPNMSSLRIDQNVLAAKAAEPIPAFALVCISSADNVLLADSFKENRYAIGMIDTDAPRDTVVNVIFRGVITNTDWSQVTFPTIQEFSDAQCGKFLYLSKNGKICFDGAGRVQKIGTVINKNTIYLDIDGISASAGGSSGAGIQGEQGIQGANGLDGATGAQGIPGIGGSASTIELTALPLNANTWFENMQSNYYGG